VLSLEEIIRRVLAQRPDMTREALLQMLQEKREKAGRLLTDEGAAHMVASDLGVSVTGSGGFKTTLDVKDLIIGASDVSVTGTVILAYPSQTFQRRDGAQGRVGRLVIQDSTGSVKVVLWDEKAELLDQRRIMPGATVRVNHGYVRVGLDGRPEVNVGRRGSLVIQAPSEEPGRSPMMSRRKIGEVTENDLFVSLIGIVVSASTPSTFTRPNGTSGKVARLQVGDETGQIRIVLWDENAEAAEELDKDTIVEVVNGRIRKGLMGEIEVHVSQSSEFRRLKESPEGIGAPRLMLRKIRELTPGLASVDVLARVAVLGQVRAFHRQGGGEGKVADVTLIDETGSVRLSLWDDKAGILERLTPGDAILLKGAYTREGLGGSVALNVGRMGSIIINPEMDDVKNLPAYSDGATPIGGLREGFPANVEGEIVEAPSERRITTRDGRELSVVSLRLRDDTGEIGVSLWNENAEKAKGLPIGARLRIRDAFVRTGFNGDLELSTRSITKVEALSESREVGEPSVDDEHGLVEGDPYEGEAQLVELSECRVEATCPSCGRPVRELSGRLVCNECGRVPDVRRRIVVEADMEGGGRRFDAVFAGEDAENLLGMKGDFVWNLISQSLDNKAPLELTRKKLRGQRFRLEGTIAGSSMARFKVLVSHFERLEG
jgi:replication factor A1